MPSASDWEFPRSAQPKAGDYQYDLEHVLNAMVSVHAIIPGDGFTAETLGTERGGNGVFIRDGVVLTIGYLIRKPRRSGSRSMTAGRYRAPCWLTIR